MLRKILAVVAGYVVSGLWVALTLSIAWMVLGAGFAFEDGTTRTTLGWAVVMLVMGFIGAIIGGWLAALIARTPRAGVWLAVVMLVLGLGLAIYYTTVDVEAEATAALAGRDPAALPVFEAASVAIAPTWYNWIIPLVGAIGAVIGGRCRTGRPTA